MSPLAIIAWVVITACVALCLYGEGYRLWDARRSRPVSPASMGRIYEPLFAWVLEAEENGTITAQEAEEAFRALMESEALELLLAVPSGPDGPVMPAVWRRP